MTMSPVLRPTELEELINSRNDLLLLDVRTPGEFESAHIPGAYNVPLDSLPEHAQEIAQQCDTHFVLVCQSGARAKKAEEALQSAGMSRLHVLDGGMNDWVAADRPTRFGPKRISLERQVRIVAGSLVATGALLALLVNPWFSLLPLFVGSGLTFAGITDTCGMGMLLAQLPYNQTASCDVPAMVRALALGADPVPVGRSSRSSLSADRL